MKEEKSLMKDFSQMAIEVSKLMSVLIASAGTTKEKGAISTKKVRKRLAPVLKLLEERAGKEFMRKPITFPTIKITE